MSDENGVTYSDPTNEPPEPEPTDDIRTLDGRKVEVEKMGYLQVVSHRENFSNCVALTFPNNGSLNAWAAANPGTLLVAVTPLIDGQWSVLATRILSKEQYQKLLRVQAKVDQLMAEEDAVIEKAKEEGNLEEVDKQSRRIVKVSY